MLIAFSIDNNPNTQHRVKRPDCWLLLAPSWPGCCLTWAPTPSCFTRRHPSCGYALDAHNIPRTSEVEGQISRPGCLAPSWLPECPSKAPCGPVAGLLASTGPRVGVWPLGASEKRKAARGLARRLVWGELSIGPASTWAQAKADAGSVAARLGGSSRARSASSRELRPRSSCACAGYLGSLRPGQTPCPRSGCA